MSLLRSSRPFAFEGVAPRVDQNDLCGEGLCRKKLQESIDRGFFYVFANKVSLAPARACMQWFRLYVSMRGFKAPRPGMASVMRYQVGTVLDDDGPCVAGNYMPCWTPAAHTYPVQGKWPEKLWKARKLSHEQYEAGQSLSRKSMHAVRMRSCLHGCV
jgi:hypothetical protein